MRRNVNFTWPALAPAFLIWAAMGQAEPVRISAGAAPTENIFERIKAPFEKSTGATLVLTPNGPFEALRDLDKGATDGAVGGLTFADWMVMMEKAGYPIANKAAYKYRVIGNDVIKVITNKGVGVTELTREQLAGIFSGKTANWKEVGGHDQPIVVVLGTKIPGTMTVFQKQVMGGGAYLKSAQLAGTADEIKAKVAATPGAIGLGPRASVDATVGVPAIPEVGRPITFITKGEPTGTVAKLLDFIRLEGKNYVK